MQAYDRQSGEGVPQSITSDCLSRLEGGEKMAFDEGVIRDVSGVMFSGGPVSKVHKLILTFLIVCYRWSCNGA